MPSPTAVLANHHGDIAVRGQPGRLLDAVVGWLPAQPDVAAAEAQVHDRPGGGARVVQADGDRVAGPQVGRALDRERRPVEHLAELPLPGRDQPAVDLQAGDPGGQDGEAVRPVHGRGDGPGPAGRPHRGGQPLGGGGDVHGPVDHGQGRLAVGGPGVPVLPEQAGLLPARRGEDLGGYGRQGRVAERPVGERHPHPDAGPGGDAVQGGDPPVGEHPHARGPGHDPLDVVAGGAEHRHRADPPGVQRQEPVAVAQQDHPVGGDPGRQGDVPRGAGQGRPPVLVGERVLVEAGVEDGEQGPPDDLVQPLGRDGARAEVLDHGLERRVVELLQGSLGDHGIDGRGAAVAGGVAGAPGLGVVADEVLDHRDDVPVLDGPDLGGGHPAGQVRVLPQRLGQPAAQRHPGDVDRRAEQDVGPGVAGLLGDRRPVLRGQALVEGRGQGQGGRERGHVVRSADAVGAVGVPQGRDAQVRHRLEVAKGDRDLVPEGHLGQQLAGALACGTHRG